MVVVDSEAKPPHGGGGCLSLLMPDKMKTNIKIKHSDKK